MQGAIVFYWQIKFSNNFNESGLLQNLQKELFKPDKMQTLSVLGLLMSGLNFLNHLADNRTLP